LFYHSHFGAQIRTKVEYWRFVHMERLVPHLRDHFDPLQDRLLCFAKYGVQTEGWFKGEMLFFLDKLVERGIVTTFDREVRRETVLVDLQVRLNQLHWLELKHWLIGKQKGTTYGASFYFRDRSSVGIIRDVSKLLACPAGDPRWLLILASANPGVEAWRRGVEGFNDKFKPIRVTSHTDPGEFPTSYFLGLLSVDSLPDVENRPPAFPAD